MKNCPWCTQEVDPRLSVCPNCGGLLFYSGGARFFHAGNSIDWRSIFLAYGCYVFILSLLAAFAIYFLAESTARRAHPYQVLMVAAILVFAYYTIKPLFYGLISKLSLYVAARLRIGVFEALASLKVFETLYASALFAAGFTLTNLLKFLSLGNPSAIGS